MNPISPVTASVLGIDIENFGSRDMDIQRELQRDLGEAFSSACDHIGLRIPPEHHQGTGDGSMDLILQDIDVAILASDLPRELAIWLNRRNRTRTAEGRLRLRVALNRGPVGLGDAWQGQTVVETARILDCRAGREALRAGERASLVLLVSDQVFDDAVREHRRGLESEDFTRIEVGGDGSEKGEGIVAWVSVYERERPRAADVPRTARSSEARGSSPEPRYVQRVKSIKGPTTFGPGSPAIGKVPQGGGDDDD